MKKLLIITIILIPSLIYFFIFLKQTKAQVCLPLTGYLVWPGTWEPGRIPMATTSQYILTASPLFVSGGNVGIDTTIPVYKLQVNGDISGTRLCIGSDCRNVWPGGGGGGGVAGTGIAGQIAFWTNTSTISGDNNLFWDNTNKRLGIGTTTPQTVLNVAGNITANTFLGTINAANVSSGQFGANTGGGNYYFMGNVGIGTTTPSEKLHVIGNAIVSGNLTLGTLSGVLKASSGFISGSATTDNLPEGTTNLYFTQTRARSSLSANAPITYSSTTGAIGLSTPLAVSYGGTGLTSVNSGYILFGNGASPLASDANLFWDNTNKRLGIGTTTPQHTIDIQSLRNDNATDIYGINNYLFLGGAPITARGIISAVFHDSSNNITNLIGTNSSVHVRNSGSASNVRNFSGWGTLEASGNVNNWIIYEALNPTDTGLGSITYLYGLKIDDLTAGTNNWSIYTGSSPSYFGGNVGIGTDNPGAKLEIVSSASNSLRLRKTAGVAGSVQLFPAVGSSASRTGTALCQTVSSAAVCLGYWQSNGSASTCSTSIANGRALCATFGD